MPGTTRARDDRLWVRPNSEAKATLRCAANSVYETVSHSVLATDSTEAGKVIGENEAATLSTADRVCNLYEMVSTAVP